MCWSIETEGYETPAGEVRMVRPRRRVSVEEAQRSPAESEYPGVEISLIYFEK
ncbi:multidrug transporter [Bacillus mesophilum]|uniref:Multidrug transporter n=1 Tax=Bacillus mesophilum TaxID=1071718 RepID=A0A7V7UXF2_9BACI|nr:multidrug transporter [Bacillus mesophilum]